MFVRAVRILEHICSKVRIDRAAHDDCYYLGISVFLKCSSGDDKGDERSSTSLCMGSSLFTL